MTRKLLSVGIAVATSAGLLCACGIRHTARVGAPPVSPAAWLTTNARTKSVVWKVFAGENNGLNFNGYSKGQMVVTVPLNWRVTVKFVNADNVHAHSAMIVRYADRTDVSIPETFAAFPHASTPDLQDGTAYGISQSFQFSSDKPGQFALVCGVPGHAVMGMWDTLLMSKTAKTASMRTQGSLQAP